MVINLLEDEMNCNIILELLEFELQEKNNWNTIVQAR